MLVKQMEEEWNRIELKTWDSKTISSCIYTWFGGSQVKLYNFATIIDKVSFKGNKMVIHWELFHVGGKN